MNKDEFNSWLAGKVEFQSKITIGAVSAMCGIGLLAFLIQGGLLFVLLKWGYGLSVAVIAVGGIFGGMGYYTWLTAPKTLCDDEHEIEVDGRDVLIRVAPTMSSAWTFAMGSMDSDQSIYERIFGMMMVVPRMFWTAWYVFRRVSDVREIEVRECGAILRYLLKKAERVDVRDIAEKRPQTDLAKTLRQVSMIDGVVFLTKGEIGLTLADRFKDDLEKGMGIRGAAVAENSSPFDE